MRPMGSTRSSSRWPVAPSPPETRAGSRVPVSTAIIGAPSFVAGGAMGASGCSSMTVAWVPRGRDDHGAYGLGHAGRAHEVGVPGEPPGRPLLDDLAGHVRVPVHAHAGHGGSGAQDGGPDAGPLELHLEGADVALEAPLRRHVGGHGGPGPLGHVGGHEDDVPPPALDESGQEGPHQAMGAADVDVQHAVELGGIGVEHGAGHVLGGVGDDDLDLAEGVDGRGREPLDGVAVGQVEVDGDRLAAGGPDGRRRVLALADPSGTEDHRVAERGEGDGGGPADARGGAGHDGRPALGIGREPRPSAQDATVVGRAARPRTLIEWTRSMPSGSTS